MNLAQNPHCIWYKENIFSILSVLSHILPEVTGEGSGEIDPSLTSTIQHHMRPLIHKTWSVQPPFTYIVTESGFGWCLCLPKIQGDTSFPGSLRLGVKRCLSIILYHGLEVWDEAEGKCLLVTKWTHKPIVYRAYGSTLKMPCPKFWRVREHFPVYCWLWISAVSEKQKLFSFKVCSVVCDEMGIGVYIQSKNNGIEWINGKSWFTMYLRAKMKMLSKLVICGEKVW